MLQRLTCWLVAAGATFVLAGCGEVDGGSNTSAAEIRDQRAIWDTAQVDDYVLDYKVRCLCPTKDRRIRVIAGRIERVDYKAAPQAPGAPIPVGKHGGYYDGADYWLIDSLWYYDPTYYDSHYTYDDDYVFTIESLFDLARRAHERAYAVSVRWDPTFGYPTQIRVDWDHNGIDDEYQFLIKRFERL